MAVHIPDFPYNLANNPAYRMIRDDYDSTGTYQWNSFDLVRKFGNHYLRELQRDDFFVLNEYDYQLKASFRILSSTSSLILKEASKRIISFNDLKARLPDHLKVDGKLKHMLAFMLNFNQIQVFIPPSSGLTYIALEGFEEIEDYLNEIYEWCDYLEEPYRYQLEPTTDLREFFGIPKLD